MQHRPTFRIQTMGCKLNFYDSEVMAQSLEKEGFQRCHDLNTADLNILNTCTVTNNSDAESRNLIRKFRKKNPNSFVVVTGCYAQAATDQLRAMEEVDLVTTNVDKYDVSPIVEAFKGAGSVPLEAHDIMEKRPAEFRILEKFEAKTRAFIKIQDGCNYRCSYCIIPFVRGNNRSIPIPDILHQLRVIESQGCEEVVLTGIHIGTWGRDFRPRMHFADLLQAIEESDINLWVRISSLDSPEIPDRMIELLAGSQKLLPHLHIPLQAGCNKTLRAMRRIYKVSQYRDRVLKLKEAIPHICLGADVIVGFPGEEDEDFEQTAQFLQEIPMDYLHVFPYSNRQGTAASNLKDQVNGRISKNRGRILRELSAQRRLAHNLRYAETERPGIVLPQSYGPHPFTLLTDNYVEAGIDVDPSWVGKRIMAKLENGPNQTVTASLLGQYAPCATVS